MTTASILDRVRAMLPSDLGVLLFLKAFFLPFKSIPLNFLVHEGNRINLLVAINMKEIQSPTSRKHPIFSAQSYVRC